MTPREQYETFLKERAAMAIEIRAKLVDTFDEMAKRAIHLHHWEAASAYQYCSEIARGFAIKVEDGR